MDELTLPSHATMAKNINIKKFQSKHKVKNSMSLQKLAKVQICACIKALSPSLIVYHISVVKMKNNLNTFVLTRR